jgi:HSP20 family molecular chaperone IbpA
LGWLLFLSKEDFKMAEKTVPGYRPEQKTSEREVTRSQEYHISPPVDIFETDEGLEVVADLPGVSKDGVEVRVENNTLTIRGKISPTGLGDPLYREYQLANFFRQFELGEKVDQYGVLRLALPKVEEVKPRKVEVKVN